MSQFWTACGGSGLLQIVIEGQAGGSRGTERLSLPQPFAVIGRSAEADLVLEHPAVSRRHAYLQMIAGRVAFVDLGSRNGVGWGAEWRRSGWLKRGETIAIRPYQLGLDESDRGAPLGRGEIALVDPLSFDVPLSVALEFSTPTSKPSLWRLRHRLTLLGRSPECQVRLVDPTVSRFHCSLVNTPLGVWAVDLLGWSGITLNGTAVRFGRLDDGDELRLGSFSIRLRRDASAVFLARSGSARGVVVKPPETPVGGAPGPDPAADRPHLSDSLIEAAAPSPPPVPVRAELIDPVLTPVVRQFGMLQQQMFDQFQQTLLLMLQMFGAMHRDQMDRIQAELAGLRQLSAELSALQAEVAKGRPHLSTARTSATAGSKPPADPAVRALPGRTPAADQVPPSWGAAGTDVHSWLTGRIAVIQDEQQTRWQKILDFVREKAKGGAT
jgi:pSer/pThr/pTyr-binding forkhead associated (FHA) protein